MDKHELLEALEDSQNELVEMLDDVPEEDMLETGVCGNWSIKDILAHLSHWEGQTVTLLFQAKRGTSRPTTVHFSKEKVDDLNQRWFEESRERSLDQVWQDWIGVRKQTIRRVNEFSNAELNNPNLFGWLRGTPLWEWIVNDTIDHEGEHADGIRDWLDLRDAKSNNGHREG